MLLRYAVNVVSRKLIKYDGETVLCVQLINNCTFWYADRSSGVHFEILKRIKVYEGLLDYFFILLPLGAEIK